MNKFNKAFSKIMNGRMFYESVKSLNHNYKQILNIKSQTAKEFYDSIIIIDKDVNSDLIFESHHDAQFNKALINKIYNAQDFTQIQASEVFKRCSTSIKENYEIRKDIPMYIFNFSFSKNSKMICTIFSSFKIEFSLKDGTLKEKYQYEEQLFKNLYQDCGGLCSDQESCVLIILNKDNLNETIVNHEMYHYLQIILKKNHKTKKIKSKSKFTDIDELQLSVNDLNYLFDDYEFETHIKVDLINFLDEMYWKFYKNISKSDFINRFIKKVKSDPENVVNNLFTVLTRMKNQDTTALRLFAACYIIQDKLYLLKAINWLKETFK